MEADAFPSEGRIVAVSVSNRKGIKKSNLPECKLLENEGLDGDAHAGGLPWRFCRKHHHLWTENLGAANGDPAGRRQ
jgi:hypothetical protein